MSDRLSRPYCMQTGREPKIHSNPDGAAVVRYAKELEAEIERLEQATSSWAIRWLDAFIQSLDQPRNEYLVEELQPLLWRLNRAIRATKTSEDDRP